MDTYFNIDTYWDIDNYLLNPQVEIEEETEALYEQICQRCNIKYNPIPRHRQGDIIDYEQRRYGKGIKFERIRRITGYLVGDTNKWNNGKKAELKDRVKHE